ncbi:hypothetical protein [Teichococcus cervicalis]|uniref:Flagellar FliJ protein n=1 Tax=Pseudoroseomonas cervicalis ATCC 49957 TaxID=525371 RepID=D5RG46_9PROT|nr:hypothetical protein [Pseudoroseomonas cervicalis]EFH13721.1 hypothetical protein HMPREF0731_0055 [Pseudoroseomonas cervicalis ATCC 49957]
MNGLPLLIRLARQQADARRTALAAAETARLEELARLRAHDSATARETDRARGDAAEMALWSAWISRAGRQRGQLLALLRQAEQVEEAEREALREDFAQLKRLEIALRQKQEAARHAALRRAEQQAEEAELRRQGERKRSGGE